MSDSERKEDPILLSWLSEYVYCKRRFYLRIMEQNEKTNVYVEEGRIVHRSVHNDGIEKRGDLIKVTGLHVYSEKLNLYGICDNVEFTVSEKNSSGYVPFLNSRCDAVPVEYKHGKTRSEIEYNAQMAGQAICLMEMFGMTIEKGYIYYTDSRRRQEVELDDRLIETVRQSAIDIREMLNHPELPPAKYKKRCPKCSLYDICMPKKVMVNNYMEKAWEKYDHYQ